MPRPRLVMTAAAVQTAYTILIGGTAAFCFVSARLVQKSGDRGAAQDAKWMLIAGCVVGVMALVYAIGAYGMWRSRRWAWWVSVLANVFVVVFILWDMFVDRDRDPDNWVAIGIFTVPIVLLMFPGVRSFYRRPLPPDVNVAA
ncbi:MAG: hypothetical protein ACR2IF_13150 [Terriglobales bacterium]